MERMKATDFPPEVLKLFDRYVHGAMSRRDFLDGAGKFAAGGMSAVAMLEALRPNYAMAQQVAKDDARIKTEYVTFPSPQGSGTMKGYLARPAQAAGKLKIPTIGVRTGGFSVGELQEAGVLQVFDSLVAFRYALDGTPLARASR